VDGHGRFAGGAGRGAGHGGGYRVLGCKCYPVNVLSAFSRTRCQLQTMIARRWNVEHKTGWCRVELSGRQRGLLTGSAGQLRQDCPPATSLSSLLTAGQK
jgi:hypothetical protein